MFPCFGIGQITLDVSHTRDHWHVWIHINQKFCRILRSYFPPPYQKARGGILPRSVIFKRTHKTPPSGDTRLLKRYTYMETGAENIKLVICHALTMSISISAYLVNKINYSTHTESQLFRYYTQVCCIVCSSLVWWSWSLQVKKVYFIFDGYYEAPIWLWG